jgi:hypothetical protein
MKVLPNKIILLLSLILIASKSYSYEYKKAIIKRSKLELIQNKDAISEIISYDKLQKLENIDCLGNSIYKIFYSKETFFVNLYGNLNVYSSDGDECFNW